MLIFIIDDEPLPLAEAERVREELAALMPPKRAVSHAPGGTGRLFVQYFGYFEVFWNGRPLIFRRQQTKELFAYLVNREGNACTAGQIAEAMWEDQTDKKALKNRVQVLISDLRTTLDGIGSKDLLLRGSGWAAIDRSKLDCDFYRLLDGDTRELSRFDGQFMQQYSWAELTAGRLYFLYHDE